MKILFLSDNFPPETNAPATRTYEHARYWVKWGHEVTVLTCAPNFPEGKVFPGYKNRWHFVEQMDGIKVVRVKTYIAPNEGVFKRCLDYFSFMVSAFIAGLFQKKPDVIVATSPQFFTALSGWMLSALRRRPFIFELRDLWPASIAGVGALKSRALVRLLEKIELFLYRRASRIIAVTESFKLNLIDRGIPEHKIKVVGNGVDLARYSPRPKDDSLAHEWGIDGKFIVGYFGTHGMAHALERVLDAAELLQDCENLIFLFVGAGSLRDKLVIEAKNRRLKNVKFFPLQFKEKMPQVWSLCDAALIHLKDSPIFATVIPSKIFEAIGMGIPILLSAPDGEAARLIRQTNTGVVTEAENPGALVLAIRYLVENPKLKSEFAEKAHRIASQFSREENARVMLSLLHEVLL